MIGKEDPGPAGQMALELRRGALVLAILSQLRDEHYGYSLREKLTRQGLEIHEGTLYPLLRRLEDQGFLESRWKVEGRRPRRYYRISREGRKVLARMKRDWQDLVRVVNQLL